jgi:hypothetical protein
MSRPRSIFALVLAFASVALGACKGDLGPQGPPGPIGPPGPPGSASPPPSPSTLAAAIAVDPALRRMLIDLELLPVGIDGSKTVDVLTLDQERPFCEALIAWQGGPGRTYTCRGADKQTHTWTNDDVGACLARMHGSCKVPVADVLRCARAIGRQPCLERSRLDACGAVSPDCLSGPSQKPSGY